MTLTFISNYINHHQIPLSDCLYEKLGENYHFVQTEPMAEERKAMGWQSENDALPYLVCSYEQPELAEKLLMESDVVVFGGCENEEMIRPRLLAGKLTFRYSERIYKEGQWKFVSPRGLKQKYHDHVKFRKAPVYLLCAGGYVASDFHLVHAYPGKMLRWGYFPAYKPYAGDDCHAKRRANNTTILLWAGRFIDWKHPEMAIRLMADLKKEGYGCRLQMIGGGPLEDSLKQETVVQGLNDCVEFCGYKKPEQVREAMECADIHLFTSDYREGWGAVLNESMNSGCAAVANKGIGAVPYLIKDGENGYFYPNGDYETFKKRVKSLLDDRDACFLMGQKAYETIRDTWNPQTAAEHLLAVAREMQTVLENGQIPRLPELMLPAEGPVSVAPVLSPGIWN